MFYIRWVFNPIDFSNSIYIITNLIIAISICISAYYYVKLKRNIYNVLISNIRILTRFIVTNKPPKDQNDYIKNYVNTFKKLKKL